MQGIRRSVPLLSGPWKPAVLHQESEDHDDNIHEDDDDASLESLNESYHDDERIGLKSDTGSSLLRPAASTIIEEATDKIVNLFEKLAYEDPLVLLYSAYDKMGVKDIGEYFRYAETTSLQSNKTAEKFWQCHFQCPLHPFVRISSCLPLALLVTNNESTYRHSDYLLEHSLRFFKVGYKLVEGRVFFESMTAAKKSTALQALLHIDSQYASCQNILFQSTLETVLYLRRVSSGPQPKPATDSPVQLASQKQQTRFPEWVHQLYAAGVSPQDFSMWFQEYFDEKRNGHCQESIWQGQPTLLCCTMEIRKPIKIQVTGTPTSSKRAARNSALKLFLTKIGNRIIARQPETAEAAAQTKRQLYFCDKQQTKCVYPLPSWAIRPFSSPSPMSHEPQLVYLYELELVKHSGQSLAVDQLRLKDSSATPLAILFPVDIKPPSSNNETSFSTHVEIAGSEKKIHQECVSVSLKHRTVLDLRDLGGETKNRFELIKAFNHVFARWDEYGIKRSPSSTSQVHSSGEETHPQARTYLFVPLERSLTRPKGTATPNNAIGLINWKLIEDIVHHRATPCFEPLGETKALAFFKSEGGADLCPYSFMAFITAIAAHLFCQCVSIEPLVVVILEEIISYSAKYIPYVLVTIFSMYGIHAALVFPKVLVTELDNRLLIDSYHEGKLFLPHQTKSKFYPRAPLSAVISYSGTDLSDLKDILRRYCLELDSATFRDYFFKITGHAIQYNREPLIEAYIVDEKLTLPHSLQGQPAPRKMTILVPETVQCLPMPRDVLYVASMSKTFMPRLERQINLRWFCHTMEYSMPLMRAENVKVGPQSLLSARLENQRKRISFAGLVDQATTIHPVTYQRLEFLGDAVLGYFLALNVLSCNSSLAWDGDDLDSIVSQAGQNVSLFGAALGTGLSRLLQTDACTWHSIYGDPCNKKKLARGAKVIGYRASGHNCVIIPDWKLSDVGESILAAAYLGGMAKGEDKAVFGLMERFTLPFPRAAKAVYRNDGQNSALRMKAPGSCLLSGYPFLRDKPWEALLSEIVASSSIQSQVGEKLASCFQVFIKLMDKASDFQRRVQGLQDYQRVLFLSALFNDALQEHKQLEHLYEDLNTSYDVSVMYRLALLRDTLACIGTYALELIVTEELFHRFPSATAGDMNLLRCCVMGKEVMSYIMYKAEIHHALFYQESGTLKQFHSRMEQADIIGRGLWKKRGGWALPGGAVEYHRRCQSYHLRGSSYLLAGPRYPGIAGASLHSMGEKGKRVILNDLVFSFKSLVGAMVLCFGVEGMWSAVGPFFEEVLLLSPEELRREFTHISPLVKRSSPGTHGGKSKRLQYSALD